MICRAVYDALLRIPRFAGQPLEGLRIERLPGLTNRSYKLTLAGQQYALRLPGDASARFIDRRAEVHNAAIAAELGLAPQILFQDPGDGLQLRHYIADATPLTPASLCRPATLRAVVELLQRLHRSGRRFRGEMSLFAKLDQYLALARGGDAELIAELLRLRQRLEPVRRVLERDREPLRPCHIDPAPANFLIGKGDKLYLLDWEYSAMCEPLWDLADLALEAGFGQNQERRLLAFYYGPVDARRLHRFTLYKVALNLLAAAWGATQAAFDDSADLRSLITARLAHARALLGQ